MKYIIEDADCNEIARFDTEKEREQWTMKHCWWSGVNWLIYDMSSIQTKLTSRTVYWYEEE